jgi:hypothetical protein
MPDMLVLLAESPPISLHEIDATDHLGADVAIGARKHEAGHLHALGWRDKGLRIEQVREVAQRRPLGRRKGEARRIVEGIPGVGMEARVPHQRRVEGDVGDDRGAPLVARALPPRTDDPVVLDTDRDRLRISEPVAGQVASCTRVVVVEPEFDIEEQKPPHVGQITVQRAPEARR